MSNFLASFVIPAYNREHTIDRCLRSIVSGGISTNRHSYEIVVVNDASTDGTADHLKKWQKKLPYNLTVLNFKDHLERVYAWNAGMLQAQGEWIVMLDSDDELASHFKQAFEDMIEMNPTAKVFNWGSMRQWKNKDGRYYRTDFVPPFKLALAEDGKAELFKSGKICSGGFAFKKECLNTIGYYPEAKDPYTLGKWFLNEYKELQELWTMPDGKLKTDLGNPWGQDYILFYMLTRRWMPVTTEQYLHYVHIRS